MDELQVTPLQVPSFDPVDIIMTDSWPDPIELDELERTDPPGSSPDESTSGVPAGGEVRDGAQPQGAPTLGDVTPMDVVLSVGLIVAILWIGRKLVG